MDTLESLEIEVKHSATGAAGEIKQVASAVRSLGKALEKVLPTLSAFQKVMGKSQINVTPIDNHTTQIADTINNVKTAASGAGKATASASKGIKELSKAATNSKSPLENFISSLKRIAFYRIIRSIIKSITSAFQEGLQNAYTFSQGIEGEGHRFAAAMDAMKSAGTTMKNQLGSAFIALLTAIQPIVSAIISLVTKLANVLSQLFAIFTGGTYLKAADVPKQWAEAAGGAGKAAKEWKNQLLGFDEINRLEEPNDGGGGGGGGLADAMSAFEDTPIDGIFKKIRDKLLELRDSLDFEPLKKSWDHLKESIQGLCDVILGALAWAWDNILVPLAHWTIEQLAPVLVDMLANAFDLLRAVLERLSPVFEWLWQHILHPLFKFIGDVVIEILENFNSLLGDLADLVDGKITFREFIDGASDMELILGVVCAALGVGGLIGLLNTLKDAVLVGVFLAIGKVSTALSFLAANPIVLVIAGIVALIAAIVLLIKHWDDIKQKLDELDEKFASFLGNGKLEWQDFAAIAVNALQWVIGAIETVIGWINSLCSWIQSALDGFSLLGSAGGGLFGGGTFGGGLGGSALGITKRASGGFVDEGQLFIANEAGAEMVGSIGGRTAVANNDQIVEGIRQGVFEAVMAANNNGNNNVDVRVYLDSREIKAGQNRLNRAMGV